ncbi:hypothetical protein QO004_000079 [Rhizobium mesoamericanum]|uniref:hypothetical protein n=1 Tax=Rhizobium mesoamericanum TaxID=1079800 RepID=UPI002787A03E|nr:hypothetical protein [Rhizobium mesoamericanum]MDQ0558306.1 hypothetical protein [Rhizobium mesoamericanum]
MKKGAVLAFAAVFCAGAAEANEIDLSVDNFSRDNKIVSAVIKLTNNLDEAVSRVFIDCAFLDDNKRAIDIGNDIVTRLDAKGYAYGKASIVTDKKVRYADCRVKSFSR